MNMSKAFRRGLSIAVLMMAFLLLTAACGTESAPTPTPPPPPLPTPTPDLGDLLSRAGKKLDTMTTAKFKMVDETESGAKFFGTTFKSMEAEVQPPNSFRMLVDVVAPGFGFVEIEMIAVGDQAYLKLSKDAPWAPLPLDQVPFNLAGLGTTLRDLLSTIKDAAITGRESVMDTQTVRVEGTVASEDLSDLITSVDSGHAVALTLWIAEADQALQQIRIGGQIYDDDAPDTTRLITIEGINVPVYIQPPDVEPGP